MKKLLMLILMVVGGLTAYADNEEGKIALSVYIDNKEPHIDRTRNLLTTKLNQIITKCGCAGDGFDDRFIVTAHMQPLEESVTATFPAKTAVNLLVTVYIGDGENGTMFSSWSTEVKGVGNDTDEAYMAAVKKIPYNNPSLEAKIEEGKKKIVEYYNNVGPSIIAQAKASAKSGDYDKAMAQLLAIPAACNYYDEAQALIGQYGETLTERTNLKLINDARAAWSADPTENGANNAQNILAGLSNPSDNVLAQARKLEGEIAGRLKEVSDREFRLRVLEEKDRTKIAVTAINAAASVQKARYKASAAASRAAAAYWNSRPRRVYHVHWW